MEIVKAFNSNKLHTNITIKGTHMEPLFRASDIGLILELSNINKNIVDFNESEKVITSGETLGGNQQVSFLTEKGLYKVLFKSRKPIAEKFQDWVCEVIKEIRLTGEYKLNKENEELKQQLEQKDEETIKLIYQNQLETHNKFLQSFKDNHIVYIILLRCEINEKGENIYIIKIGKSENLPRRTKEISTEYMVTEPLILDIYESQYITDLETSIKNHSFLKNLHYDYTTKYNKIATETYSVNDNELKDLKIIIKEIKDNLSNNYKDMNKKIQLEELNLKNNEIKLKMIELLYDKKCPLTEFENNIVSDIKNEIISEFSDKNEPILSNIKVKSRTITSDRIPEIYQYSPENLTTPLKKYNSPIDLARENSNIALNSLRLAITNNTIYKDYRWIYVNRNEEPPEIIPLTKETIIKSHDKDTYLARMDDKKSKIISVYTSHREAIDDIEKITNKKTKTHSFNRAIKTGGLQFGFCWNYFDKCSMELQNEYLSHSKLPEKYVNPMSKSILKICPHTGTTIESFNSKVDAAKKYGISTKTLNILLDTGKIHEGFIWKGV
jgi:prophage antirepressor-like protein